MPLPGQNLAHFRIVEKIGEGGMCEVWKAVDTHLDREVAIKILPPDFRDDADRVARLDVAVAGDVLLLASLIMLGGDFWDKLRSLFVYGSRAQFPVR